MFLCHGRWLFSSLWPCEWPRWPSGAWLGWFCLPHASPRVGFPRLYLWLTSFFPLLMLLPLYRKQPPTPTPPHMCLPQAFLDPARKAFSLLSIHHILLMTFFCLTLCYLHTSFFSCVSFEVNEQAPRSPLLPAASRSWSDSQSLFAGAPEG